MLENELLNSTGFFFGNSLKLKNKFPKIHAGLQKHKFVQ